MLTSNVFISVADGKSQTQSFHEVFIHSCNFQFYFPSELSNLYIGCLCLAHPNNSLCSSAPWLTFLDHFTVTGTLWVCYAVPPPRPSSAHPLIPPESQILGLRSSTKRLTQRKTQPLWNVTSSLRPWGVLWRSSFNLIPGKDKTYCKFCEPGTI